MRSLVWGGDDYPITQPWGGAPDGDGRHCGVDIGMPSGTPLFAARAGSVVTRGTGYFCLRADGLDQRDWYLHVQSSMAYAAGTHVDRGDPVAVSGVVQLPGGPPPTGPHLHFEVQTGILDVFATSLNPVPVLNGLFGGGSANLGGFGTMDDKAINDQFNEVSRKASAIGTALQAQGNVIISLIQALPTAGGQAPGLELAMAELRAANAKLDELEAEFHTPKA